MRRSALKNTVAILRVFLDTELKKRAELREKSDPGMSQTRFGKLIGKTKSTVQKLESGDLPLSEATARDISESFGVSLTWLLNGNPKARILETPGLYWQEDRDKEKAEYWAAETPPAETPSSIRPYTLQSFERASQKREQPFGLAAAMISGQFDTLANIVRDLKKEWGNHPDGEFRLWKLKRAVQSVRDEFPPENA